MVLISAPARLLKTILALGVTIAAAAAFVVVGPASPSYAVCVDRGMVGSWRAIDVDTRSVTRVDVRLHCGDQILCDEFGNCTGGATYFTLRPFGKCHPTDCEWGTQRATDMGGGWQRAQYTYIWATKHVWVKTYAYYGRTYLRVWVLTDFTAADGRADYSTDQWMLR